MWKEVLLNRWFLSAVGFLIVVIIGCISWLVHVDRQILKENEALKLLNASYAKKKSSSIKTPKNSTAFSSRVDGTSAQVETQRKYEVDGSTDDDIDIVEEPRLDTSNIDVSEADDGLRLSLFGYGPYPEVPLGLFPEGDGIWTNIERIAESQESLGRDMELMVRVRIKLWELGTETVGATGGVNGVHPIIPNVAYVKWGWLEGENGEPERYIKRIKSPAGMHAETRQSIELGEIPQGWIIMDFDEGIINPYTFLELE